MQVGVWRKCLSALAASGCLLMLTGCGANVVGPFARWRYQLQIQRPFQIEPMNPGLPAPVMGDPAPCDPNRCAIRHMRNHHTLPREQDPVGLPAHPAFHPVPVCPVFGPVTYGGAPPRNDQILEEIQGQPMHVMPPGDGAKEMPAPPATNPPAPPADGQTNRARLRTPAVTKNDLRMHRTMPASYEDRSETSGEASVRFISDRE